MTDKYKIGIIIKNIYKFDDIRKELYDFIKGYAKKFIKTQNTYETEKLYLDFIVLPKRNIKKIREDYDEIILTDSADNFPYEFINKFKDLLISTNSKYLKDFKNQIYFQTFGIFHLPIKGVVELLEKRISSIYGDEQKEYFKVSYRRMKIESIKMNQVELQKLFPNRKTNSIGDEIFENKKEAIESLESSIELKIKNHEEEIKRLQEYLIYENYFS